MRRWLLAVMTVMPAGLASAQSLDDWQFTTEDMSFTQTQKALLRHISPAGAICRDLKPALGGALKCEYQEADGGVLAARIDTSGKPFVISYQSGKSGELNIPLVKEAISKLGLDPGFVDQCPLAGASSLFRTIQGSMAYMCYTRTGPRYFPETSIHIIFRKLNDF